MSGNAEIYASSVEKQIGIIGKILKFPGTPDVKGDPVDQIKALFDFFRSL